MRHLVVLAAILSAALFVCPPPPLAPSASAQDKKKDGDKDKEKERKKEQQRREKVLTEIGANATAKSTTLLLNRVPKDGKLRLALGAKAEEKDYSVDTARGVLDTYFDGMQTFDVDTTNMTVSGSSATYGVKFRRKGKDTDRNATLSVSVGAADAGYPLTRFVVDK